MKARGWARKLYRARGVDAHASSAGSVLTSRGHAVTFMVIADEAGDRPRPKFELEMTLDEAATVIEMLTRARAEAVRMAAPPPRGERVAVVVRSYERGGRFYADEVRQYDAGMRLNSRLRGSPLGRSEVGIADAVLDFFRRVKIENPDLAVEAATCTRCEADITERMMEGWQADNGTGVPAMCTDCAEGEARP